MAIDSNSQIQSLLHSLNGQHGILGCVLVSPDGKVISSTLPAEFDVDSLGALSATLYSNNDISIQRMNRGNLVQMTLLTDKGILHFCDVSGNYLVVLTAAGQKINLEKLIASVEEQSNNLAQVM